jgi:hypothetical protein
MFQAFLKVTVQITTTFTNKLQLAYEKCEMNTKYSFPLHTTVRTYLKILFFRMNKEFACYHTS